MYSPGYRPMLFVMAVWLHRAHHRPEAIAAVDDIRRLREAMQHVSEMEIELGRLGDKVSGRSIELKSAIKKRLSSPTMLEVWGGDCVNCVVAAAAALVLQR